MVTGEAETFEVFYARAFKPFDEFVAESARAAARADHGKGHQHIAASPIMTTNEIAASEAGTVQALATAGTYSVVCMGDLGGGELAGHGPRTGRPHLASSPEAHRRAGIVLGPCSSPLGSERSCLRSR